MFTLLIYRYHLQIDLRFALISLYMPQVLTEMTDGGLDFTFEAIGNVHTMVILIAMPSILSCCNLWKLWCILSLKFNCWFSALLWNHVTKAGELQSSLASQQLEKVKIKILRLFSKTESCNAKPQFQLDQFFSAIYS